MSDETPLRVLIVDDDEAVRMLALHALKQEGLTCDVAENGVKAEAALAAKRYDAMLTDLQMPGRNGHALAVGVLAQTERPLIVVLTAAKEPRLSRDLYVRGVDDVVYKPTDFRLLAIKLRAMILRQRKAPQPAPTTGDAQPAEAAAPVAEPAAAAVV